MIGLRTGEHHGACVPSLRSRCAVSLMLLCAAGTLAAAPREAAPRAYWQIAAEFGLPATVLYAAALTASGRAVGHRGSRPWPWTLSFKGKRYQYLTRRAAHRALTTVLARGGAGVRVGLMALPWRRYAAELGGPWAALDPYSNLRVVAARLAPHLAGLRAATSARAGRSVRIERQIPGAYDALIARLAPRFSLDPRLVREVVAAESAYDPRARSLKGAQGLMQLMPATAARFGVRDVWDPEDNLTGGMRYLAHLLGRYRGDLPRVLGAYNAGEEAVDRHGDISPYAETRAYVARILERYKPRTHPSRRELALDPERAGGMS
jgi:soluble lytic murein transglycosylase-like protein